MPNQKKSQGKDPTRDTSKLPPHNIEAEEAVLGSCLVDPGALLEVQQILKPSDFFRERNRWVYEAMLAVGPDGLNQITVAEKLREQGRLEAIGGAAYLASTVERLPTSLHAVHYASIVHRLAWCRSLIGMAGQIAAIGYEADADMDVAYQKVYGLLFDRQPTIESTVIMPHQHVDRMGEFVLQDRSKVQRIELGYHNLDMKLGGLYPGNMVVIGARPGVGKSQVLQEIVTANCNAGFKVLVASAEMTLEEWDERQVAMETGISIHDQRTRPLTPKEEKKVVDLIGRMSDWQLFFIEGRVTLANIQSQARFIKETKGLDLIVVDYVQLLADTVEGDNLREKVGLVSRTLKRLAREMRCPLIVTSQLSRQVELRSDKRPILSDLKETSDLEQDADYVLLLHRPELYWSGDPRDDKQEGILHVYVAKVRQGGNVGRCRLLWSKGLNRYYAHPDDTEQGVLA